MRKHLIMTAASLSLMSLAACTTTGNTEKGAAIGAASGAIIGAVIGNNTGSGDAGTGAAIGAVVGGVGGAVVGREKDKRLEQGRGDYYPDLDKSTRYYDEATGRYYFRERGTSNSYYENGERRT